MIEIRGQDGSEVVGVGPDPSDTVLGRGRGLHTRDRTVSRDHLILKFDPRRPASLSFEVTGRNPLWVMSQKSGRVRVYRNSDKGWVDVGDGFCVSGKEPLWFFLEEEYRAEASVAGDGGGGGEVDIGRESKMDDRLEVDVSGINPVKEFDFLVVGHEFDSYPNHALREVKDWDWFLEESSKERDNCEGGSDEARSRRGRMRKRKKAKDDDDAMEEDDKWTGESEEDEEALQKANKAKKGVYWTRSRDPLKPTKNASSIGASSSMQKKTADRAEVKVEEDKEDDDETLGGFIVDDDDAECEEGSNDCEDEEDEFIDEEEEDE